MAPKVTPQQDTGWGVIYRLNGLFSEVEILAPSGKYDDWNIKLDRIWSNLVYRNPLEWKKEDGKEDGKIIGVKFCEEDFEEKEFLDNRILKAKSEMTKARNKMATEDTNNSREYILAKRQFYQSLMLKEIWLKKYMHTLGLYLKEVAHNPGGAMWGK